MDGLESGPGKNKGRDSGYIHGIPRTAVRNRIGRQRPEALPTQKSDRLFAGYGDTISVSLSSLHSWLMAQPSLPLFRRMAGLICCHPSENIIVSSGAAVGWRSEAPG